MSEYTKDAIVARMDSTPWSHSPTAIVMRPSEEVLVDRDRATLPNPAPNALRGKQYVTHTSFKRVYYANGDFEDFETETITDERRFEIFYEGLVHLASKLGMEVVPQSDAESAIEANRKRILTEKKQRFGKKVEYVETINDIFSETCISDTASGKRYYLAADEPELSGNMLDAFILLKQKLVQLKKDNPDKAIFDQVVAKARQVRSKKVDNFALNIGQVITDLRTSGQADSYRKIADKLNDMQKSSPSGKGMWLPKAVERVEKRYWELTKKPAS